MSNMFDDLDFVVKGMGREPNKLEKSIIYLLCDRGFVHHGTVELTEDYSCVLDVKPLPATGDFSEKVVLETGKMFQGIISSGVKLMATLIAFSAQNSKDKKIQAGINQIGLYNNIYGVPTVGGDICFDNSLGQPFSADMMVVGLLDNDHRINNSCQGVGNLVYLIGEDQKSVVPLAFSGRTLHELVCQLHDAGIIVALQHVGETGIIGACTELLLEGTNGMNLSVGPLVPDQGNYQSLFEYVPGKLVVIIQKEQEQDLLVMCRKWNKKYLQIGTVIEDQQLYVRLDRTEIANIPVSVLAEADRRIASAESKVVNKNKKQQGKSIRYHQEDYPEPDDYHELVKMMMTDPNLLSRQFLFEQFDSTIGTDNLTTNFISDASVLQIKGSKYAVIASFCDSTYDLFRYPDAVSIVVAEAIRKTICSGGSPCAITGCLGIADVDKLQSIKSLVAETCKEMGIQEQVIRTKKTDNLSMGAVAFLDEKRRQMTMSFKNKGDMVYLIGKSSDDINSSEYIRSFHQMKDTPPPAFNLQEEINVQKAVEKLIARRLVVSAHSVSRGGLFMALLESAIIRGFGFDITADSEIRKDAFLFGESSSRVVVSVSIARETDFIDCMIESKVPFLTLGHVTKEEIRIDDDSYGFISDYIKQYYSLKS